MHSSLQRFSLPHLMRAYNENKDLIDAHYGRKTLEGLDDSSDKVVLGMSIGVFMFFLLLTLILFVWAVYLLIARWQFVKTWVKVVAVLALIFGMPIFTVILMYAGTEKYPVNDFGSKMKMRMCGGAHY